MTLNGVQTPFQTFIRNTDHGSVIGAPGISLPAGLSDGLPVGIELDGLPGQDSALLAAAAAIETVLEPFRHLESDQCKTPAFERRKTMQRKTILGKMSLGKTILAILLAAVMTAPPMPKSKSGCWFQIAGGGLFGPSSRNSAQLAAEDINAAGGINGEKIELVFADVGALPAQSVQAAMRLWRGEGVKGFVRDAPTVPCAQRLPASSAGRFRMSVHQSMRAVNVRPNLGYRRDPCAAAGPVIPLAVKDRIPVQMISIGNDYNWPRDTNKAANRSSPGLVARLSAKNMCRGSSDF